MRDLCLISRGILGFDFFDRALRDPLCKGIGELDLANTRGAHSIGLFHGRIPTRISEQ